MTLTSEQEAIVDVVRDFAAKQLAPYALAWDKEKLFPVDVLRAGAELGIGGLYVGEDVGGAGLSRFEAALVIEALATGCPSIASYVSIHNMVASMIDRFGTPEQRAAVLPSMVTMEALGSYCLTEPGAGSDAASLTTRAVAVDGGYELSGVKQFISGAGTSKTYVVMARTSDDGARGITAFIVDGDAAGLSFGPNEEKMGWNAQPTRQVIMDRVLVPTDRVLGAVGGGFAIAMSGLDGGRVNIAASSLGGAESALAKAMDYLRSRVAFGAPLIEAQALRFRLADMRTRLEAARSLLHRAVQALDAGDPEATALCAMAKQFTTDAAFEVANDALQLHGGYGYLHEYGVEKIVRDLRVHQILEGTNEIMRVIVSRTMIGSAR